MGLLAMIVMAYKILAFLILAFVLFISVFGPLFLTVVEEDAVPLILYLFTPFLAAVCLKLMQLI